MDLYESQYIADRKYAVAQKLNRICSKTKCIECDELSDSDDFNRCPYFLMKSTALTRKITSDDISDDFLNILSLGNQI